MKTQLCSAALALLFATAAQLPAANPSVDEMAVQTGVVAWLAAWNGESTESVAERLKPLFANDVVVHDAEGPKRSWTEYAETLKSLPSRIIKISAPKPEDLEVKLEGTKAVSTFTLFPKIVASAGHEEKATTRVKLVWKKSDAFWRIAEQKLECSGKSRTPEAVVAR